MVAGSKGPENAGTTSDWDAPLRRPRDRQWPGPRQTPWLAGILLGSLIVLAYYRTLSPTINSFDSAEFVVGAYSLGIVHATGYPLYLLLGHGALQLSGFHRVPLVINALSALYAVLAALLLFALSWRLSRSILASFAAAILFAFSRLVWSQSVIAEVNTLNGLFFALVALAACRWLDKPSPGRLWFLAAAVGLGLTNHVSVILLMPALLLFVLPGQRLPWWSWAGALLALVLPLLLYFYLPWRFAAAPALNYVGWYFDRDLTTLAGVWWMASGGMFADEILGVAATDWLSNGLRMMTEVWLNLLGAGLLLAVAGGLMAWRTQRRFVLFLGGATGIVVGFYTTYNVVDTDQMLIPALVMLTPLVSVGVRALALMFSRSLIPRAWKMGAELATAGVLVLLTWTVAWSASDRSDDFAAYDFATQVLATVEMDAVLLAQWTTATPLLYGQIVEGSRPDVLIVDRGLMTLGLRDRLRREGVSDPDRQATWVYASLVAFIDEQLAIRPVYLMEDDPVFRARYCYQPQAGGIFRLWPLETRPPDCG